MPISKSQLKASQKYIDANTRTFRVRLSYKYDADLIARLDAVGNMQGYIKQLIRDDIQRHPEPEPVAMPFEKK